MEIEFEYGKLPNLNKRYLENDEYFIVKDTWRDCLLRKRELDKLRGSFFHGALVLNKSTIKGLWLDLEGLY